MAPLFDKVRSVLQPSAGTQRQGQTAAPLVRHSNGLKEFTSRWTKDEGLRILDIGPTSSSNLMYISNLGHRVYAEDLLAAAGEARYQRKTEEGMQIDVERFFADNARHGAESFDGVLLWDAIDYLPEPLVQPLIERLQTALKPAGYILAYFHSKDTGPATPFYRYHIRDAENLELREAPPIPLKRVLNNRSIENLFAGCRSRKFFLSRDNLREVLVIK